MPRFDQSFTGLCEQNLQDTLQLKQRYLDAKAKRGPKSKDKKQQDNMPNSIHVQQKFLKRSSDDHESTTLGNSGSVSDSYEPPVKLQCTTQQHTATPYQNEGLTKFSVEIVQQLEFTTSAANSQPQQISTNVTVKAHTNASVKSDVCSPKSSNPSTPVGTNLQQNVNVQQSTNVGNCNTTQSSQQSGSDLSDCVKQEPDNDFADLEQCAAALEKDAAANGGAAFGNFSDLIGEDTNEIMSSAAFKDLISDITTNYSDYPDLMKELDFENKPNVGGSNNLLATNPTNMKMEDIKEVTCASGMIDNSNNPSASLINKTMHSPMVQHANSYSPPVFDNKSRMPPATGNPSGFNTNMEFSKTDLSPAAQTLKQMAEQHQHKNQMGLAFSANPRVTNSRSPYSDFQYQGDYVHSPNSANYHNNKSGQNFSQHQQPNHDIIKQEMIFQQQQQSADYDMKRKPNTNAGLYKQQAQYSPYGSPNSHGSPGYMPNRTPSGGCSSNGGPTAAGPPNGFRTSTPPRPPSGGNNGPNGTTTLQINQAQQLNINQQNHGHGIQVSQTQTINFTQQSLHRSAGGNSAPPNMNNIPINNSRILNQAQAIEQQQKLLQQQQILRVQQAAIQQNPQHIVRPPPPDYKTCASINQQALQQQRYQNPSQVIRRMPSHQQGGGPMIRVNMYQLQQQVQQHHPPQSLVGARPLYPRQQSPMGPNSGASNVEQMQNPDWRHMIMQQQQNSNFGGVRPNFQPGFNMAANNLQMSALQHQQIRQQNIVGSAIQAGQQNIGGAPSASMVQMNSMNQTMLTHMQQQQSIMQQNSQISIANIHLQQNQNITINNPQPSQTLTLQQQQHSISSHQTQHPTNQQSSSQSNNPLNNFPPTDFNFEFLDSLPTTDPSTFTDQELLNSFDADSGFNIDF